MNMQRTAQELAALCGAELSGDPERVVRGTSSLESAGPEHVSFFGHTRYGKELAQTRAGVLVVPRALQAPGVDATLLRCERPNEAFARIFEAFGRLPARPGPAVHPTAIVGRDVELGEGVSIGAYCVLGDGARLGAHAVLHPHVVVGARARVGEHSELRPFVTLYDGVSIGARCLVHSGAVIGADGFGFDPIVGRAGLERWDKVPHGGTVEIGDEVEIGANSCVDRARFEVTRVGDGAKLDNLVHVAHNVQVGRNVLLIAQVGIAGSTRIGDGAVLAGQVGVNTHIEIGAGARVAPGAKVWNSIEGGRDYGGYWAMPRGEWLRNQAHMNKLSALAERVRALEKQLEALAAHPRGAQSGNAADGGSSPQQEPA